MDFDQMLENRLVSLEPEWQVRNYRDDDASRIVSLINIADGIDMLDRSTSETEWEIELGESGLDPYRDVFVVELGDGPVIGEAEMLLRGDSRAAVFFVRGTVHPDWRRRGVGLALMNVLLGQAQVSAAALGLARAQFRGSHVAGREPGRQALFERFGMQQDRAFYRMVFPSLGGDLPEPALPPGISLRTYMPGQDDAAYVAAVNDAFRDHWNHFDESLADWQRQVRSPEFRPELTLLAVSEGEIVGLCYNKSHQEWNLRTGRNEGHISTLGVRRPWRKQGVATALLAASLRALRDAGMESADLGVDSESLTGAVRLYERVGFQVSQTWLSYSKFLPPAGARLMKVDDTHRINREEVR